MKDKYYISIILIGFSALFATTLLLDLEWIQQEYARQVIVYLIMILIVFIIYQKLFHK